jgi:hypothetical protein
MSSRLSTARTMVVVLAGVALALAVVHERGARERSAPTTRPTSGTSPRSPARIDGPAAPRPARDVSPAAADPARRPESANVVAPPAAAVTARATPAALDLAALPRAAASAAPTGGDDDRFPTTPWFTREDRDHPERYFELAARMPELNRPQERRATLAYFRAYREKLDRDLAAAGDDPAARGAIAATVARYDAAIARLGATIAASRE